MKYKAHHQQQMDYFDHEFAGMRTYRLEPWQQSYISKIHNDMLRDNFRKQTLLDIATGSGYVAVEYAKSGMKVIACDLSETAIANLQRVKKKFKLPNLRLITCYAESIPLPDKSVDYIVANAILEHIPDEAKTIREWKRLLKPNGRLLITVPIKFNYVWPFFWPLNYIHDRRIGHLRRYDLPDLQKKFGMRVKKVYYTGHILKVIGVMVSLLVKINGFATLLETLDKPFEPFPYGASNISVIFEKGGK